MTGLADLTNRGDGPLGDADCGLRDEAGTAEDEGDCAGDGNGDGSFSVAAALPVAPVTKEWGKSNRFDDSSLFGTSIRDSSPEIGVYDG